MRGASGKEFNKAKGDFGEAIAVKYLRDKRFKILETNYRNLHGEIDIIAKKDNCIHFIEVKYRQSLQFGHGRDAVGLRQQGRVRSAANSYLTSKKLMFKVNSCFDIIEIHRIDGVETIEHLVNCF